MAGSDEGRHEITQDEALSALGLTAADLEAYRDFQTQRREAEDAAGDAEVTDNYAEALAAQKAELEERFTAELKQEREARQKVEEAFAEEQRKRRLAEFTDHAKSYGGLAVEVEQFGEDLMTIADAAPEAYGRLVTVLKAADEQIRQGELFTQFSKAGGDTESGDPFEREVERVRRERFSDEKYHEGWTKAFEIVSEEKPELAREYVREGR